MSFPRDRESWIPPLRSIRAPRWECVYLPEIVKNKELNPHSSIVSLLTVIVIHKFKKMKISHLRNLSRNVDQSKKIKSHCR